MNLTLLDGIFAIYQFSTGSELPDWVWSSPFYSVTRTQEEISVVAIQNNEDLPGIKSEKHWRILKINGSLDFSLFGIISEISGIMMEKKIPVFVISTYNTDYFLIKEEKIRAATNALLEKGHKLTGI